MIADGEVIEIITEPSTLTEVRAAIEGDGVEVRSSEVLYRPTVRTQIDEPQARTLLKLIDLLEGDDDVSEVHANFDVDDEILERVLA